jgi:hypothetical protein
MAWRSLLLRESTKPLEVICPLSKVVLDSPESLRYGVRVFGAVSWSCERAEVTIEKIQKVFFMGVN